jgi:hypothetical protein
MCGANVQTVQKRDTDWPKKSRATVIRESIKNKLGTVQDNYHDVFDNEIPFNNNNKNHISNESSVDFHGLSMNFREVLYYKKLT